MKKINKNILLITFALLDRIFILPIMLLSMNVEVLALYYIHIVVLLVATLNCLFIKYIIHGNGIKDVLISSVVILLANFIFEIISLLCIRDEIGFQITFDTLLIGIAQILVIAIIAIPKIIRKLNK